jgi:hypothetical protein
MLREAAAAGVPYMWVTGGWLEEKKKCYVMCVSMKEYIKFGDAEFNDGGTKLCVGGIVKGLPERVYTIGRRLI